jgi:hypothetical protein
MEVIDNAGRRSRKEFVITISTSWSDKLIIRGIISGPTRRLLGQRYCSLLCSHPHSKASLDRRWLLVVRHLLFDQFSGLVIHRPGHSILVGSVAIWCPECGIST